MSSIIVPTILTDSFASLQMQADAIKYSPLVDAISVDVIDGLFVDNLTITPLDLTVADFEPTKIDFHFMTEEPMDFVYECVGIKEYLPIRRIYGQVERMSYQRDFLQEVRANNWEAGLALDLFTSFDAIDEELWPNITHLLLMGVEAGYQGHEIHPHILEKLRELREYPFAQHIHVSIDGGVKLNNAMTLLREGANELIVGSALWQAPDPLFALEEFYKEITEQVKE
jgi:ribulose-phosphate 3-epimerase